MQKELTPVRRFEDLVRLRQHKSDLVRQWVDDRLEAIESLQEIETPDSLARWIEDENEDVAVAAIELLGIIGARDAIGLLRHRFETARGRVADVCARTLADLNAFEAAPGLIARLREKDDRPAILGAIYALGYLRTDEAHAALRTLLEATADPWLLPPLFESLLKYWRVEDVSSMMENYLGRDDSSAPDRAGLLTSLKEALALGPVVWYIDQSLKADKNALSMLHGEAHRAAKRLSWSARRKITQSLGKREYAPAIRCMAEEVKGLVTGPSRYRQIMAAFVQGFEQNLSRLGRKHAEAESRFLLAGLIRLLEEVPEWSPQDSTDRLLEILRYEGELPLENDLVERELPARRAEVVEPLLRMLEREAQSVAAPRAVGALGRMREARAIPHLLKLLGEDDDILNPACERALVRIGSPVLASADEALQGDDVGQQISLLAVLAKLPFEETVDRLLAHYERLVQSIPDMLLSTLEDLGSRRALSVIERDVGKEEFVFDNTFLLLCDLHEIKHPILPELRVGHWRERERQEKLLSKAGSSSFEELLMDAPNEPFHLKLECRACGRTYTYTIERIYLDPGRAGKKDFSADSDMFFKERLVCKNCGAEDAQRFTNEAMLAVLAEMMRLHMLADGKEIPPESQRLVFAESRLSDGTRCTPQEGIRIYKRRIEADPDNPEWYARIGCLYSFLERYDEAIPWLEKSREVDPNYIISLYHLANVYAEMKQERRAARLIEEFINLAVKKPKLTREERDCLRLAKEEFDLPEELGEVRFMDQQGPIFNRPEPVTREKRVGPNEPCPCGSGKKYKKCCMVSA